jgi:hypothetical protein
VSSSTAKRLILYRFDRPPADAVVHSDAYLTANGVELMTRDGKLQVIGYNDVKALCFSSEGAPADLFTTQTLFERRPKIPGLWTSFLFRDGDVLQGILPHNLLEWPFQGYLLTPPRASVYRQRVFVPRQAIREAGLLGIVGKPASTTARSVKTLDPNAGRQLSMFD